VAKNLVSNSDQAPGFAVAHAIYRLKQAEYGALPDDTDIYEELEFWEKNGDPALRRMMTAPVRTVDDCYSALDWCKSEDSEIGIADIVDAVVAFLRQYVAEHASMEAELIVRRRKAAKSKRTRRPALKRAA
jgi:hypothetical protein